MVGIRSRELCQAPISASVILSLAGVVGESLSFSTLQVQRRLRPDSNARLEATYCHSHFCHRALTSVATTADFRSNLTLCWKIRFELKKGLVGWDTIHTVCMMYKQPISHHLYQFSPNWGSDGHFWGSDHWFKSYDTKCKYFCFPVFVIL